MTTKQKKLKNESPDFELYNVGKKQHCRMKIGSVNIDAPVDDVVKILVGMGLLGILCLLLHTISQKKK